MQAFRDLMGQLLSESDSELENWKHRILQAVGENGQVLIEVIPELEYIIGTQPEVLELSGSAAQNRFNLLFSKFVQIFTTKEHPLVIFLDDLQWADSASLNLFKLLMKDSETGYLLVLGAYRDNEVFPAHPLMLSLDELRKNQAVINTITLEPLAFKHINQLTAETLICEEEKAQPLSELVYQKTQGNPFFTTQFLKGLYEDELITFNQDLRYWECDLSQIRDAALTDDVVEFMAGRLQKLPEETQKVLKLAACIGNRFNLETLAIVQQTSELETATYLWEALKEGLILPTTEVYKFYTDTTTEINSIQNSHLSASYKFLHDRVQQAAYFLIPEEQKKITHFNIGTLLLDKTPEGQLEEKVFDIVPHLNQGIELITSKEKQLQLCELNLLAAQKAKSCTAYIAAWEYLETGIQLLKENCWQTHYQLTLNLYTEAVEIGYLKGDLEMMETMAEIVLSHTQNILDRVKVYEIQLQRLSAQSQYSEAIEVGLNCLKLLRVDLPLEPTAEDIGTWLLKTKTTLEGFSDQALIELPDITDLKMAAAMRMLVRLGPPTYFSNPNLLVPLICKTVLLSLEYGSTFDTPFIFTNYGLVLCDPNISDFSRGYRIGKIGEQILKKQNNNPRKALVLNNFYLFISHWVQHYRHSITPFQEGCQSGLEVGDLEFAGYNLNNQVIGKYCVGQELSGLILECKQCMEFCHSIQVEGTVAATTFIFQTIHNLIHISERPWSLQGEFCNEAETIEILRKSNNAVGISIYTFSKLYMSYLFEGDLAVVSLLSEVEDYLDAMGGHLLLPPFTFIGGLIYLSVAGEAIDEQKNQYLERAKKWSDRLELWASHAPMNYQHKSDLMQAEKCRVLGHKLEAIELFDKAIAGAKENEYIQEEALANELAAKFYLDWGKEKIAQTYMIEAYYCYARWGAKAKTNQLEKLYPELLVPVLQQSEISFNHLQTYITPSYQTVQTSSTSVGNLLDFNSVMKASQALSSEIELKKLITQLMQVILENAGATKGVLIFNRNQQLTVEAIATYSSETESNLSIIQQTLALEDSSDIPLKLINLVKRQQQPLVINDIFNQPEWASDAYIIKQQPKSTLCLPILSQGKLQAILYLENHLITQAFTSQHLEVLKLLCSQAAISLENAELYQQSQDYAHQLEQFLTQLQEAQLQLVQSEKMSALGQMMSGITHEINNPLGFVSGNISQVEEALQDLFEYIEVYHKHHPPGEEVTTYAEEIELDYVLEDLPEMVTSMKTGINRIKEISKSMRIFSRADRDKTVDFDLHEGLESTLLILKHRLKATDKRPEIKVIKDYAALPQVNGFPGQLNQVFMNILANAIDVFDEMSQERLPREKKANRYQIALKTELDAANQVVTVRIRDNGCGMSDEITAKVFEHLFTTKAVGKGTGLGLSIARKIVVDNHRGNLECHSTVGEGTEFVIRLPI
ncbi:MAG: ATP-binding protein [Cyanobacteria bacterium J06592_8]